MADEQDHLDYQDFVDAILQQLYQNRKKHKDHHDKGLAYMFMVCSEQLGQLGYAIATKDIDRAIVEVAHVAAVLFEVYERLKTRKQKADGQGKLDSSAD